MCQAWTAVIQTNGGRDLKTPSTESGAKMEFGRFEWKEGWWEEAIQTAGCSYK
jgi:hypothetical protein